MTRALVAAVGKSHGAFLVTTFMERTSRSVLATALGMLLVACGDAAPAKAPTAELGPFAVVAEGPCPKLAFRAVGDRRFLVYGDDGYALENWVAGERLAAAESIVETRADGAFRSAAMLRGLPRDGRGYVPFDVDLGGSFDRRAWLLLVEARYEPHGHGALFERSSRGYVFARDRFAPFDGETPVDLPEESAKLPPLPKAGVCGDEKRVFVPLASATTPAGGVFVGGRCDDGTIKNVPGALVVAHGAPAATAWSVTPLPDTEGLDGIVNLAIDARSDTDATLVAYEPFRPLEKRKSYMAAFDGNAWHGVDAGVEGGLESVAHDGDGRLYIAAGRGLYLRAGASVHEVALPPLPVDGPGPVHVRAVHVPSPGEVWVEATYTLRGRSRGDKDEGEEIRGGVIYSTAKRAHTLYCDARLRAEDAIYEVP